ncbi:MAG: hypothetical protein IKX89_04735 [Firmicutes bacterium]|nr:hypothetical protein [Bacillota bacterium]
MKRSVFILGAGRSVLTASVLLAVCLCPAGAHAYTTYEVVRTLAATVRQVCTITAWHYSGGYWMADNGSGTPRVRIPDDAVSRLGFAAALSERVSASWRIKVPEAVQEARRNGAVITTDVPERGQYYSSIRARVQGGEEIRIDAAPVINVCSRSLKDYVPGIRADIPLVSREDGRNLYALYGKGLKGATAQGAYSESQPYRVYEPYIHPTMIKNSIGTLVSDGSVYVGGKAMPSKGLSVGLLTLIRGGAVGVQFDIPITVYFYAETLIPTVHESTAPILQDPDVVETRPQEPDSDPAPAKEPQAPQEPAPEDIPRFSIDDYMLHRAY